MVASPADRDLREQDPEQDPVVNASLLAQPINEAAWRLAKLTAERFMKIAAESSGDLCAFNLARCYLAADTDTQPSAEARACAFQVRLISAAFDRGDYRWEALERLAKIIESLCTTPESNVQTQRDAARYRALRPFLKVGATEGGDEWGLWAGECVERTPALYRRAATEAEDELNDGDPEWGPVVDEMVDELIAAQQATHTKDGGRV